MMIVIAYSNLLIRPSKENGDENIVCFLKEIHLLSAAWCRVTTFLWGEGGFKVPSK